MPAPEQKPEQQTVTISRPLVGVIALVCLITGGVLLLRENEKATGDVAAAAFVRVGVLMSAFWFALPPKGEEAAWAKVSPWTFVGMIGAVFFVVARPRIAIPLAVVLAVAGFFLRPKRKQRPPRHF